MKCLITGANGFVGSYMIEYILKNHPEYEIYGMYRSHTSSFENVEHIKDKKVIWVECDIVDIHSVNNLFKKHKFDKIFHLAANSFVPASYEAPSSTIEANVIGTINMLEAVKVYNEDATILICSSSEVYGHQVHTPTTEEETFDPISPYALSKVGQDLAGKMYHKMYGLKTVISRAFTHSGARRGDVFFTSAFCKQIARIEAGLQEPFMEVGNLESHRTIMHVKDCVRAYWELVEKGKYGEAYNIGGKETWGIADALNYMLSLSPKGKEIKVEVAKRLLRPKDVNMQKPSIEKFQSICNWKPEIPVKQVFRDVLNYWRGKYNAKI